MECLKIHENGFSSADCSPQGDQPPSYDVEAHKNPKSPTKETEHLYPVLTPPDSTLPCTPPTPSAPPSTILPKSNPSLPVTNPPAPNPSSFSFPGPMAAPNVTPSPMGAVAQAMTQARQQGLLTSEELDQCSLCPVEYIQDGTGNMIPRLEALPLKLIRDTKQAVSLYGIQAPYVKGLLQTISSSFFMLPQDWKDLFRMILTGPQYVVWESDFRRELEATARRLGGQATTDLLFGSGQFDSLNVQAQYPHQIFTHISLAALRAIDKVDDASATPIGSFSKVHQGPHQPFTDFINDLQKAVERQISNPTARSELLLKLAYENANEDCKRILQPLAAKPESTLSDFLKACRIVGTNAYNMETLAMALQGGTKPAGNCFNCGKPGHFKAQCRAPGGGASRQNQQSAKPKTVCPRCKEGFHWANQCRSGKITDNSGN